MFCRLVLPSVMVALLVTAAWSAQVLVYRTGQPAPVGTVRISRPAVTWKVVPPENIPVTAVTLSLNGVPAPATYSPEQQSVIYEPPTPLAPGTYSVSCRVVLGGVQPIDGEWQFTVAEGARVELTGSEENPAQQAAMGVANHYRRLLALSPFRSDTRLSAAATAHSRYLHNNRRTGHFQWPGTPGFIGVLPRTRRESFGYYGGAAEGVSYGSRSVANAVKELFDAPYHRMPFLQPGFVDFGVGRVGRHTTLEFGVTEAGGTVIYPVDGQRNVPLSWDGIETPNPLRIHGNSGIGKSRGARNVGYVITLFHFSPDRTPIQVTGAAFTTAGGQPVPFFLNSPASDSELKNGAFLIPKKPLKPTTTYAVFISAVTASGEDISRSWRFTTGKAAPARPRSGKRRGAGRR